MKDEPDVSFIGLYKEDVKNGTFSLFDIDEN